MLDRGGLPGQVDGGGVRLKHGIDLNAPKETYVLQSLPGRTFLSLEDLHKYTASRGLNMGWYRIPCQ